MGVFRHVHIERASGGLGGGLPVTIKPGLEGPGRLANIHVLSSAPGTLQQVNTVGCVAGGAHRALEPGPASRGEDRWPPRHGSAAHTQGGSTGGRHGSKNWRMPYDNTSVGDGRSGDTPETCSHQGPAFCESQCWLKLARACVKGFPQTGLRT